jgi:DNA-binding transcriptional LysR family regulator
MTGLPYLSPSWFMSARLKLRHLQLLVAYSRCATLQDAAASLGMSQPAASRLLGDLEDLIGTPLFRQEGRRLRCTYFGEVLTRRATAILDELDRTRVEFNALIDGRTGHVSIGTIDGPAVDLLTNAILLLQKDYPQIDLEIRTGSSVALFRDLMMGEIDIMVGRPVAEAGEEVGEGRYDYHDVGPEPMVLAARDGHPLAGGKRRSLDELAGYPWVLQRRGGRSRARVEQLFREADIDLPERVIGSDSLVVTLAYLARSDALTVLSGPVAQQQARYRQVSPIPNDLDLSISPYGLLTCRDRQLSPVATTVMTILRDAAWTS